MTVATMDTLKPSSRYLSSLVEHSVPSRETNIASIKRCVSGLKDTTFSESCDQIQQDLYDIQNLYAEMKSTGPVILGVETPAKKTHKDERKRRGKIIIYQVSRLPVFSFKSGKQFTSALRLPTASYLTAFVLICRI